MSGKPDDLEAVRKITEALQGFQAADQERILRWAREKAGLTDPPPVSLPVPGTMGGGPSQLPISSAHGRDLRGFVAAKAPGSDVQFAATVAYYYRFEAPESEKKDAINAQDLLDACRKAGRTRPQNAGQTLRNAHRDGLLDRAEPGSFSINAVGENLVAMTLPSGSGAPTPPKPQTRANRRQGKKPRKTRS